MSHDKYHSSHEIAVGENLTTIIPADKKLRLSSNGDLELNTSSNLTVTSNDINVTADDININSNDIVLSSSITADNFSLTSPSESIIFYQFMDTFDNETNNLVKVAGSVGNPLSGSTFHTNAGTATGWTVTVPDNQWYYDISSPGSEVMFRLPQVPPGSTITDIILGIKSSLTSATDAVEFRVSVFASSQLTDTAITGQAGLKFLTHGTVTTPAPTVPVQNFQKEGISGSGSWVNIPVASQSYYAHIQAAVSVGAPAGILYNIYGIGVKYQISELQDL